MIKQAQAGFDILLRFDEQSITFVFRTNAYAKNYIVESGNLSLAETRTVFHRN